jgi:hypothetical protein
MPPSASQANHENNLEIEVCWGTAKLIATLSSTLLAFALYVTLRPVNRLLARLAMIFSLEDSFLALIVRMSGFVRCIFTSPHKPLEPDRSPHRHWRT